MVDHVEFAHPQLIENLLNFWRSTGLQRFAFLLGRYETYDKVPMGVKAVVEAITEPAQEGDADGLTLGVPWEDQARIERLAKYCGMSIVGMIYTDLSPLDPTFSDPESAGKVLCKRHKDSFFVSGCEVMFSSVLQKANPNPSRFSSTGKYNSKFVTCVISGTEEGAIDVSAYQISEQGMAMVSANMIEASVSPNIIRVKLSDTKLYVPEVFYRYKNEYKIDVKESAKPTFPIEYLLVTATHGFPTQPTPSFLSFNFPIENRPGLHDQRLESVLSSIASVVGSTELYPLGYEEGKDVQMNVDPSMLMARQKIVGVLSDWHLLCFLDTTGILDEDDIKVLCKLAVSHDVNVALDQLLQRTGWQTLAAIAMEHAPPAGSHNGAASIGDSQMNGGGAGTGAYAGKSGNTSGTGTPANATTATNVTAASGRRPESPIIYNGSDDDEDFNFGDDDDEEEEEGDEDMFEDAASNNAPDSARFEPPQQDFRRPSPITVPTPVQPPSNSNSNTAKACPHCTFENEAGATDCDVCGLPL
jgi:nuclear protein localization family protein 4